MLQYLLADRRVGGEVAIPVEEQGGFVSQIIPLVDTTVTDGGGGERGNTLTSCTANILLEVFECSPGQC